jgi:citrate lyase subunit beta / citryl-CoA lyase
MPLAPARALFDDAPRPPALPACEHFAGNEKYIRKAFALQAAMGPVFDVTCDLDDGTAAGREADTATLVSTLINDDANRNGRAGVRIHPYGHPAWKRDVEIVVGTAGKRLAYVSVPKVDSRMDALKVASYIEHVAEEAGRSAPLPIHAIIETHGGLREVAAIAELPPIEGVVFGLLEFISSHAGAIPSAATYSPGQFDHPLIRRAKLEIAAAAHCYGRVPVHNITTVLDDPNTVFADARRAASEFGYLRMYSIHPDQIDPIVRAMRPAADEVATAAAIIHAAHAVDWAPIRHADRLHDRASFRHYWQVLARAHATGAALPDHTRRTFFAATTEGTIQ